MPQGSTYTSIEPQHDINKMCHLADTGMILMAVEDPKMLAYYVPVSLLVVVEGGGSVRGVVLSSQ